MSDDAIEPIDDAIEPIDDAALAALARPAIYGAAAGTPVEHVQTHISHVFLVGEHVYKLKKAVRFSFLDFGTRERRRFFCAEELRLNRRLAAPVYVDVRAIVRRRDGTLALAPAPEDGACSDDEAAAAAFVEPILHMRRLPAARLLPALLADGAVDGAMMRALAGRIAAFHRAAPTGPEVAVHASPAALARRFDDALNALRPFVGAVVQADDHATLVDFSAWYVARHAPLLVARQAAGRIREGHGDLHAEHVCFVADAAPPRDASARPDAPALPAGIYVFDCVEFSRPFRCNDVASEIAFLTMDLEARGRRDLGEAFAAAYVGAADDPDRKSVG